MITDDNNEDDNLRDINSAQPFHRMALKYMDNGWMPIPLLPGEKRPYNRDGVGGFTGNKNKIPDTIDDKRAKIVEWLKVVDKRANVGLWLHSEVIGIDVDNYADGDKEKRGALTLRQLERRLGKLPKTWISTARSDGVSGIRLYRIPIGLQWGGKAGADIDIIQTGHRFAACYPSYHPTTKGTYQWYSPGAALDGKPERPMIPTTVVENDDGHVTTFADAVGLPIPNASKLPKLPEKWVDSLTHGKIKATVKPIDMDSTGEEIEAWATKNFPKSKAGTDGNPPSRMCKEVRRRLDKAKASIKEDASSHDKILNGHWSILNCGIEGHYGVLNAAKALESVYTKDTLKREKRDPDEVSREVYRSRKEALRKIKGKADSMVEAGANPYASSCACFDGDSLPKGAAQGSPRPTGPADDPGEYRLTDDGNAAHLCDLYKGSLAWVPGQGEWIFWTGKRWEPDEDGLARRCYWAVKLRQEAYAQQLLGQIDQLSEDNDKDVFTAAKAKAKEWAQHAKASGNYSQVTNALDAVKSIEGVTLPAEQMDSDATLLGVNNGVIKLLRGSAGFEFRQAEYADYVTVNTNVDYSPLTEQIAAGGDSAKGVELWAAYLERFVPDVELRHFVQKALGYCLLGKNEERLAIFLYGGTSTGKSTLLNVVMAALGNYAETVDLSIFKEKASGLNPALAKALPKRVITSSEAGMHNHMHADLFKRIIGNDRISAELKGVNTIITRIPAFTPIIATNSPPTIKGADEALNRRLLIIPFNEKVDEAHDEKSAGMELDRLSGRAVLAWLVDGWAMYAQEGLRRSEWPLLVKETTVEFSDELNEVATFLKQAVNKVKLVKGTPKNKQPYVTSRAMHDAYVQWCLQQRVTERDVLNKIAFGRQLASLGIKTEPVRVDGSVVKVYVGYEVESNGLKVKTFKS